MYRRCFLTAVVAVAAALVAPSTSKAQFTVNIQGTSGGVAGNSLNLLNAGGVLVPPGLPLTVNATAGGTTASLVNGTYGISTPTFSTITGIPANAAYLFANAGVTSNPLTSGLAAGEYIGGSFGAGLIGANDLNVNTSSENYIYNNTNTATTITVSVTTPLFTTPGSAGSLIGVSVELDVLIFRNAAGTSVNSVPGSSITEIGSSSTGATTAPGITLTSVGNSVAGSTGTFFSFTDPGAYSLTQSFTITLAAGASIEFQANMDAGAITAPAPTSLVTAAIGAPFVLLLRRRLVRPVPTLA
jgi:hypothetical protein